LSNLDVCIYIFIYIIRFYSYELTGSYIILSSNLDVCIYIFIYIIRFYSYELTGSYIILSYSYTDDCKTRPLARLVLPRRLVVGGLTRLPRDLSPLLFVLVCTVVRVFVRSSKVEQLTATISDFRRHSFHSLIFLRLYLERLCNLLERDYRQSYLLQMRSRATHTPNNPNPQQQNGGPLRNLGGTPGSKHTRIPLVVQRNLLAAACLFLVCWVIFLSSDSPSLKTIRGASECQFYFGPYRGPQYYSPESGSVAAPKCIVESKWLKLSQHTVKFPGSQTTFDDWMWIDYHDRINVLVEDKKHPDGERRFLVFQQSKYALEGRSSKAIIGGIIEPGEDPEAAARREVDEEMNGLQCEQFHALGRYRTDVNRGMGWLHGFLATGCSHDTANTNKHVALADEVGAADAERQDLESITLTELRELARNGEFLEVQWTATVALALLHPELMNT
jgi:ADP-ribose pyrophosphatase YjhB (NUDIX family)